MLHIKTVKLDNIDLRNLIWHNSKFEPEYPEPWASEQSNLESELTAHPYLGWNGCWSLTFGVPVFTWIHQTQNLGWIYG
jgi:hypothetical protein